MKLVATILQIVPIQKTMLNINLKIVDLFQLKIDVDV